MDQIPNSSTKSLVIRDKEDERGKEKEEEQRNFNLRIFIPQGKHKQDESVCLILGRLDFGRSVKEG